VRPRTPRFTQVGMPTAWPGHPLQPAVSLAWEGALLVGGPLRFLCTLNTWQGVGLATCSTTYGGKYPCCWLFSRHHACARPFAAVQSASGSGALCLVVTSRSGPLGPSPPRWIPCCPPLNAPAWYLLTPGGLPSANFECLCSLRPQPLAIALPAALCRALMCREGEWAIMCQEGRSCAERGNHVPRMPPCK
jgi:hypothetical protein